MNTGEAPRTPMNRTAWLICIMAAIGFAFDIYELLMLPLIIRPALQSLIPGITLGSPEYMYWARILFFVPAIAGGIFGLLGGYLTDRLGRRRVLTFSILLYAFSALAAGYATTIHQLLFFRCLVFIGVCVEFVAAVAWLAELFPNPKQREKVLGYTQAFSSLGGLMVSGVYVLIAGGVNNFPEIRGGHEPWRYMLVSGVLPALPLIIIRPFLPESPIWAKKKLAGTLRRPSFGELFAPNLLRTTVITTVMFACAYGAAFGAIQQLPQIVPGLAEVTGLAKPQQAEVVGKVQLVQEIGGLAGRFILAILAVQIVSRQKLIRIFQVPGLIIVPLVFYFAASSSLTVLKVGVFFAGLLTVAQFSFWGNYLPRAYPVHLRGTGESFAANIGGRIFGTSFAWITLTIAGSGWLTGVMPGASAPMKMAYTAAGVAFFVYFVGLICSFMLPEPPLEEEQH